MGRCFISFLTESVLWKDPGTVCGGCVVYALGRLAPGSLFYIFLSLSHQFLSYPRMLRPDCSARLAALQLLQSVPCDLWTNRSHRQGVSLDITLKTHTDHHIAHNNKNEITGENHLPFHALQSRYIVCRSIFHGIHMQVGFYISKIKANS